MKLHYSELLVTFPKNMNQIPEDVKSKSVVSKVEERYRSLCSFFG